MRKINLSQNKYAIVDDADFEYLNQWKWSYGHGYAYRGLGTGKSQRRIYMHRFINSTPDGLSTDHINNDRLDNRRENLRTCTDQENQRNHRKQSNNTSGYIGVSWHKAAKKWRAYGDKKHLGMYDSAQEAAKVRDEYVSKLYGKFAKLNFRKDMTCTYM